MRAASYLHIPCIALIILVIMHFSSGDADAVIACYQCHGAKSPIDYRPVDAPYRNMTTGGFRGNHRTHMGSSATSATCAKCHPGSQGYTSSHRNGSIKVSGHVNSSIPTTLYKNSTSAFPQTATPNPGSCTNVNCHFESSTPAWGSAAYSSATNCNQCHDGTVPLTATHATHKRYSSGLMGKFSTYAACVSCHVNYVLPLNFTHATSVGQRPIKVSVGGYTSGSLTYLPSQAHGAFGTCADLYCHSPGAKATAPFTAPNQTATWGGTLGCEGCHAAIPPTGSHTPHVSTTYGVPVTCCKCHAATVMPVFSHLSVLSRNLSCKFII